MGEACGALNAVEKYLYRCSFDNKVAGYKPASLEACKFAKNELLHTYFSRILASCFNEVGGCFSDEGCTPRGRGFWKKLWDGRPCPHYGKPCPSPSPFINGRMKYFKNGHNSEGGVGIFKVCWHSWQRGANLLILLTPHYITYPPFFKCCPPRNFSVTFNPYLYYSFCCHVSLAEWVITPHLMFYFT